MGNPSVSRSSHRIPPEPTAQELVQKWVAAGHSQPAAVRLAEMEIRRDPRVAKKK